MQSSLFIVLIKGFSFYIGKDNALLRIVVVHTLRHAIKPVHCGGVLHVVLLKIVDRTL
jgi:hypothetical protein